MKQLSKEFDACIAQVEFILKRIQPRKHPHSISYSTSQSDILTPLSPPEESSGALGKQLGESYLKCLELIQPPPASSLTTSSDNNDGGDNPDRRKKKKEWENLGDKILRLLCNANVNIAVVDHFFAFLATVTRDETKISQFHRSSSWVVTIIQKWWVDAVVACEDYCTLPINSTLSGDGGVNETNNANRNSNFNVISYAIRGFVQITFVEDYVGIGNIHILSPDQNLSRFKDVDNKDGFDNMVMTRLLQNLKLSSSRSQLIRECICVSFQGGHYHNDEDIQTKAISIRAFLMPLLGTTIISAPLIREPNLSSHCHNDSHHHHREEAGLFLNCLLQECHNLLLQMLTQGYRSHQEHQHQQEQQNIWDILSWLISSLELFYDSSIIAHYDDGHTTDSTKRRRHELQKEHVGAVLEIGFDFVRQLLDLVLGSLCYYRSWSKKFVSLPDGDCGDEQNDNSNKLGTVVKLLDVLLVKILPVHVVGADWYCSPSHRPIWKSICEIVRVWSSLPTTGSPTTDDGSCTRTQFVSPAAIYRLTAMSLQTSNQEDVAIFLQLISSLLMLPLKDSADDDADHYPYGSMVLGSAYCISCMFLTAVPEKAGSLVKFTSQMLSTRGKGDDSNAKKINTSGKEDFFELFNDDSFDSNLYRVKLLQAIAVPSLSSSYATSPLSISKQNDALLLGLSILCTIGTKDHHDEDDNDIFNESFAYLDKLLTNYPHLGRRCLPVLIASCNRFLTIQHQHQSNHKTVPSSRFMKILEFLCFSVARDAHCAHEIWSCLIEPLLHSDSDSDGDVNVKCMTLRLLSLLCLSNQRLYGRIRDALAAYVNHRNIRLKIAVAATICDLAQEDIIRDVTDVIGWIQSFLVMTNTTTTDFNGECLLMNYAIMSLHYLVVGEELDYTKVIKVLNKKLVNLTEVDEILKLEDVVIEALVVLLGDGEEKGEDSDSEDSEKSGELLVVPQQVKASVATLVDLALSLIIETPRSTEDGSKNIDPASSSGSSKLTIFSSICKSLANYSLLSLGIDENTVRSAGSTSNTETTNTTDNEDIVRYNDLKRIINRGIEYMPTKTNIMFEEYTLSITKLASKFIKFEGDVLGQSLWKKRYGNITTTSKKNVSAEAAVVVPKKVIAALPSYESVYQRYIEEPSLATASATLLSLRGANNGTTVDKILILILELANDMENLSPDPVSSAISIRSWVSGMAEVWQIISIMTGEEGTSEELVTRTIDTILGWRDELDQKDTAYIALAAFILSIPDTMSHQIDATSKTVTDAYVNGEFDDVGMACTSLGYLAIKSIQCSSFMSIDATINVLEKELINSSKSGDLCFEAAFNLSLIAQSLATSSSASKRNDLSEQIRRIVAMLIIELSNCFVVKNQILLCIASDLKAGTTSTDLLEKCNRAESHDFVVHDGYKQAILSLYIALSLAIPAVLFINKDIICGLNILLLRMPWGYGKGFMLASAFRVSKIAKLTSKKDSFLLDHCSKAIEECYQGAEYDDVLLLLAEISNDHDVDISIACRCKEILEDCEQNFSLAVRVSTTIAVTKTFGLIPILFGGDGDFFTTPQLRVTTSKKQISQMLDLLITVADDAGEDTRVRDAAVMNIGILSSMKYEVTQVRLNSQGKSAPLSSLPDNAPNSVASMIPTIPLASDGTFTAMIAEKINGIVQKTLSTEAAILSLLLLSLKCTSLPTPFAKLFEVLLRQDGVDDHFQHLKEVCVDLIVDQASALRRAAADRREFVRVAEILARLPPASYFSQLGLGANLFTRSLDILMSQWMSATAMEATKSLWLICCYEITHNHSSNSMMAFLASLEILLDRKQHSDKPKGRNLSSDTLLTIQKHLVSSFFPTLCSTIMPPCQTDSVLGLEDNFAVWTSFFSCLSHVPIGILDMYDFFSFQKVITEGHSINIARVHAISFLQKKGILTNRENKDLFKAQIWTAKQKVHLDRQQMSSYWLAALHLAQASFNMSLESRKDLINALFEIMLVEGICSMCLELLSTHTAVWTISSKNGFESTGYGCELLPQNADFVCKFPSTLTLMIRPFMLKSCPQNFATQMGDLHMSSFVMNRALQVLSDNSTLKSDLEDSFKNIYIKCLESIATRSNDYGGDSSQQAQHISFIASTNQ